MRHNKPLIIFTGGGTGGPVTPLLALYDEIKIAELDYAFLWLGTSQGPERGMVAAEGIEFKPVLAGKLRRYFDKKNFVDVLKIIGGFFQSLWLFTRQRPAVVLSAGSHASVPVVWAAWLMQIPVLIHQQDVRPGLANKLMSPFAALITTTFAESQKKFKKRSNWIGNPIRSSFRDYRISPREAARKLGISEHKLTVLVMGGGTGAQAINELVMQSLPELSKAAQILHITGTGKQVINSETLSNPNYKSFEFLDVKGMAKVFAVADLVVSRCGLGTLTELSYLGKPALLIPMPDSHQEDNAEVFWSQEAAMVLDQHELDAAKFTKAIMYLLKNEDLRFKLHTNIRSVMRDNAALELMAAVKNIIDAQK